MKKLSGCVVFALVLGACSSIAPVPIKAGDVCYRCRRVIVEPRLAAQAIDGGMVSNFRSTACLAKYLTDHPQDKSVLFATDYASGRMFPISEAFFVPTLDRNNGEKDYIAFSTRAGADAEAFSRKASWVRWATVLDQVAKGN